ncbi:tetratricopeptide repeat protein [Yersinia sp. Marseille-Q3913]|uniref:tetratricopeptide repeat protein n=1 Tax=Yersinia sp. Marseille-Q3913 TaxID=2830769 RepID=UPI001BAE7265|nr:tetratricopeptide repeat protein [Yersinia sp. Marseille-Q3913]MBS0054008.1 tetratricopeptide repeat protein [Yersinia sp. Marseille-Q3913]
MYNKIKSTFAVSVFVFLITGCSSNHVSQKEFSYRESILLKANNYGGLISLYRDQLKRKEDDSVRLKLANAYYLAGDSQSSLYYSKPIVDKENESYYILQTKNLINSNDTIAANIAVKKLLVISPNNSEAHNLNGIILANKGEIHKAKTAFEQARSLFISDETAMNNLAVVAMLDERYTDAVRILLPDYLAGNKNPPLLHNLVFSLIQLGDTSYAKKIIIADKMATDPDELILALSQVSHLRQQKLNSEGA